MYGIAFKKNFDDFRRNIRDEKILYDLCVSQLRELYRKKEINQIERIVLHGFLNKKNTKTISDELEKIDYQKLYVTGRKKKGKNFSKQSIYSIRKACLRRLELEPKKALEKFEALDGEDYFFSDEFLDEFEMSHDQD